MLGYTQMYALGHSFSTASSKNYFSQRKIFMNDAMPSEGHRNMQPHLH